MNTSMKVILTAIGIAVLATPAMAQDEAKSHRASAAISNAHGSASGHTRRTAPAESAEGGQIHIDDCVRTTFPQCGGN